MVDARFSSLAALATLIVAALAAVQQAWAVAAVFALLSAGFALRALQGYRRPPDGRPPGASDGRGPDEPSGRGG